MGKHHYFMQQEKTDARLFIGIHLINRRLIQQGANVNFYDTL